MSRKIGRVLSIDIIQHAGAHSRGRIRHNGRRYTLFGAFSGVQSCCADRARSERYYGCPSGTDYAPSAFPRPWGVPGPNIWRNIASGGAIQIQIPSVTQKRHPEACVILADHFLCPTRGSLAARYDELITGSWVYIMIDCRPWLGMDRTPLTHRQRIQ